MSHGHELKHENRSVQRIRITESFTRQSVYRLHLSSLWSQNRVYVPPGGAGEVVRPPSARLPAEVQLARVDLTGRAEFPGDLAVHGRPGDAGGGH